MATKPNSNFPLSNKYKSKVKPTVTPIVTSKEKNIGKGLWSGYEKFPYNLSLLHSPQSHTEQKGENHEISTSDETSS